MESMIQNIQIYSLSTLPDAMQSILNRAVSSNFKSRSNPMPVLKTAALSQNSGQIFSGTEISQQLYLFLNRS